MNSPALEKFLAKIYTDPTARARFLADPRGEALHAGLTEEQAQALESIDKIGLKMASRSFARKREWRRAMPCDS